MNIPKHIHLVSRPLLPAPAIMAVSPFWKFLAYLRYLLTGCIGPNPKELET